MVGAGWLMDLLVSRVLVSTPPMIATPNGDTPRSVKLTSLPSAINSLTRAASPAAAAVIIAMLAGLIDLNIVAQPERMNETSRKQTSTLGFNVRIITPWD